MFDFKYLKPGYTGEVIRKGEEEPTGPIRDMRARNPGEIAIKDASGNIVYRGSPKGYFDGGIKKGGRGGTFIDPRQYYDLSSFQQNVPRQGINPPQFTPLPQTQLTPPQQEPTPIFNRPQPFAPPPRRPVTQQFSQIRGALNRQRVK